MKRQNLIKFFAFLLSFAFFVAFIFLPFSQATALQTWTQVNTDGFGDANYGLPFAMIEYDGNLYAIVRHSGYTDGIQVWRYSGSGTSWTQVNTNGFGDANNYWNDCWAIYNGKLYVDTENDVTGTEVWEYDGTTWTQANADGFGDAGNIFVSAMKVFNNKLYALTRYWPNGSNGGEVWEYDGSTWTQVNVGGFGDANNSGKYGTLDELDGQLIASTNNAANTGVEFYRYSGSGTDWTQININGFGDANNYRGITFLYNNSLYAASDTFPTGVEVWRYSGSGTDWTQVNIDGFGDANNSGSSVTIFEFIDDLYVTTDNPITGEEVWRYNGSGTDWAQINTDGFGLAANAWSFNPGIAYNNKLYLSVIRSTYTLPSVWEYDGSTWTQVNVSGFGDANNDSVISLINFDNYLYAIAQNAVTGVEVWSSYASAKLDLSVSGPSSVSAGQTVSYDFTVENSGPDDAGDIELNISLPTGSTFQSCAGVGWTCVENSIEAYLDEIPSGQSSTVTVTFTAPSTAGDYNLSADVSFGGVLTEDSSTNISETITVIEDNVPIIPVLPETGGVYN